MAALTPVPQATVVAARLASVRARIAGAGADPERVRVVAVTKGFGPSAAQAALAVGLRDLGENYAAELVAKAAALATAPGESGAAYGAARWHFIGAVQRRRVRDLAPLVAWWHTVARVVEGEAIAARAPGAVVLAEVETTGIPGRNGVTPGEVPALVAGLRVLGLDVRGLMTVGPPGPPEASRAGFRTVARLGAELGLPELSMGMTGDLEVAVEEGSTIVRVGRALFGERPPRAT